MVVECAVQCVRCPMVVQFEMGASVLDQFGRGFGAAACFRMWWFAQLKLLGLLLELRQCRGVMWSRYELTELGLCTLGLGDVMQWCVSCSCAAVNQGSDTSVYLNEKVGGN